MIVTPKLRKISSIQGFYACKTPADGSCLLHAVMYLITPWYREHALQQKKEYVLLVRAELADILPNYWGNFHLEEASKALPDEYSFAGIQKCLRSTAFLNEFMVSLIEEAFNIQIIIYSEQEEQIYQRAVVEKERKATIFINYRNSHFESLLYQISSNEYIATFHPNNLPVSTHHL